MLQELQIPLEQYRLDNGLAVLLHRDDSVPIVAVNVWYHVGSKDEESQRTGLAHLFEHLMFEGSANHDAEYFGPLQEAGGSINGSTSRDRTNYYEVVPSNFLELALWMEAERMAHLLPALSPEKLENQRAVVMNERRQRIDNRPYGHVEEELARLLYPSGHPYSWPVIGRMEHLRDATLEDVCAFFRSFYHPANASLVVAGCFESEPAKRWIEDLFGPIESGPPAPLAEPRASSLEAERRLTLSDEIALPRLDIVWPVGERFSPDEPALDVAAEILGGRSKDSRLRRRLVHDQRLVNTVGTYNHTSRLAGQFGIHAYALTGTQLADVEQAIDEEIDRLRRQPPSAEELGRARHFYLNQMYSRMETVLARADALNHYLFYEGVVDQCSFTRELERYERISAEDVCRVVNEYLSCGRAVIEVVCASEARTSAPIHAEPPTAPAVAKGGPVTGQLPGPGATPAFALPSVERAGDVGGLSLVVVHRPRLPRVHCLMLLDAGAWHDPADKIGLARLTADVLDEGTATCTGLDLARRLDSLGGRLVVESGVENTSVSLRCLRQHLEDSFAIFADVIQHPRFAADDVQRELGRLISELAYRRKQPSAQANDAIDAAIFGARHPYGRPADGTDDGLAAIAGNDLSVFHREHFHPARATLLAVGDIRMSELQDLVAKHFAGWAAGLAPPAAPQPLAPDGTAGAVTVIERPGAAQSVVRVGKVCVPRTSPAYYPLLVLNTILGGQFASRLNMNLREEKGYTYGVRSSLMLRRHSGAFIAGADVQSSATTAAVREILSEISDLAGARPITDDELDFAKAYLTRRFPARFETNGQIAAHLAQLAIYDLPNDFYDTYLSSVEAITREQILAAAEEHFSLGGAKVVIVGDAEQARGVEQLLTDT